MPEKRRRDTVSSSASSADEERRERHYMVRSGDEFDGRYCVKRELGKGTFGRVVEMFDKQEQRTVAVKVCEAVPNVAMREEHPSSSQVVRAIEKYKHEAEIEANIIFTLQRMLPREHNFPIVRLQRCFDERGHYCLVLDPMGPSLYHRLRDIRHMLDGAFQPLHLTVNAY